MLTPTEAARLIVESCAPLAPERRALAAALDLVLAEDVVSQVDLPPWDNSGMDGYAVRAADIEGASAAKPVSLRVIETVHAGRFPKHAVGAGEAIRVATGSPVPAGADGVIRQEDTEALPDGRVSIRNDRDARRNVRPRGQDIRQGASVLRAGTELGPAQLGVLASVAHAQAVVHRPPRVAFFGSGDEIADLDHAEEILAGKKIASANSYTISGMVRRAGGIPVDLGIARDTKESLAEHFDRARDADLLVTTAGVSVGEHDLVRQVLRERGCEMKVQRVRMRPGAPLGFGVLDGRPWIGLPGNPVSTMVTFELFARPAIRRMLGHALPFRRAVRVRLGEPTTVEPSVRHFLRVVVAPDQRSGELTARLTGPQGSGILTSMARANALLIVPEDRHELAAGAMFAALLLDDHNHVAQPPF